MRGKGININEEEEEIILKAKVQLASSLGTDWVKKESPFDNSMGAKDSCELCELVGLFMISKIKARSENQIYFMSVALYRDDLILETIKHGTTINGIKSLLTKIFQDEDLKLCEWEEG